MSNRVGVVVFILSVLAIMAMVLSAPDKTPSVTSCETQWHLNRHTADNGYMTHDLYIANCEATLDDLRDGSLDGR